MTGAEPHHTSYEKIVERPEQWALEDRGYRALKKSPWVVTEKIHGANFALLSDGQTVRCSPEAEELLKLLVEDILEQLETDAGDSLRALPPESRVALEAHVRQEAEDLRTLYLELRG